MNVAESKWIENVDLLVTQAGGCAWGISHAVEMEPEFVAEMDSWIANGKNAEMDYLRRHADLKKNLNTVLPGCRSILVVMFPYYHSFRRNENAMLFSRYALGQDYHTVIKRQLKPLSAFIRDDFEGKTRICVDSAPVAERYWALKCGVGSVGKNGLIYVPGYGSWVFVGEILSTAELPEKHGGAGSLFLEECKDCRKCVDACPGNAIEDKGKIDCRRCRSYLTVEYKGESLPSEVNLKNRIYGCDICQEICPVNNIPIPDSSLFSPKETLVNLSMKDIQSLDEDGFKSLVKGTAATRIDLNQLKRNAGLKDK